MKTTIDLPEPLLRKAKATAAARGESLDKLVASALRLHLTVLEGGKPGVEGWRRVFGRAKPAEVAGIDAAIEAELGWIDPSSWS